MSELTVSRFAVALIASIAWALPAHAGDPNACPVAFGQSISVAMGSSVNFNLMATDADNDPLQFMVTQPPFHGILVVNANTGAASYTPVPGYCGPDSFKFTARDHICTSNEAIVGIVVCPADTPTPTPTATPTATATNTPVPQGGSCSDQSQCATGLFCVDSFCCDAACESALDRCDLSGHEGTCTAFQAGVPAASSSGVVVIVGLLLTIGVLGVAQLRRQR